MKTDYLTFADVVVMHEILIDRYGGSYGLRDPGALEAALFRPQSGYYEDIISEAAALWESLVMNHPFVDGNKRIGFAGTYAFLGINGYKLSSNADKVAEWVMIGLKQRFFTFENIEIFLKENVLIKN